MRDRVSLTTALLSCPAPQLAEIAHLWGLQGYDLQHHELIDALEKRADGDLIASRFVWETLVPTACAVLFRLLAPSARAGITRAELTKKTHLSTTEVNLAIEQLKNFLLVYETKETLIAPFVDSAEVLYETGREFFKVDRTKKTLDEIIAKLDDYIVYNIFQNYDIRWEQNYYNNQASLGRMISATLSTVTEPLDFLRKLQEPTKRLYLWLREQGGKVTMQDVRKHTEFSDFLLGQMLQELERSALAFDGFSEQERFLFIPQDVYAHIRTVTKTDAPATGLVTLDYEPAGIRHADTLILYDLAVLINAIYQQNIEPTQVGRVPKRIANKLRPLLQGKSRIDYEGYDDYHEMLFYALTEFKVLQLAASPLPDIKPRYEPGPELSEWSQAGPTEQVKRLLRHWLTSGHWLDIAGVQYVPWDLYGTDLRTGREVLLKHLRRSKPGHWYTIQSLLRTIWQEDGTALEPETFYRRPKERPKSKKAYENWLQNEGEVYIGFLASSLYELGLVGLSYALEESLRAEHPVNPDFWMLTELGAAALDTEVLATPTEEQARLLVVQPNFEVMLLQPHFSTLYSILPFVQVSQIGVVSRMTLTRQSVLRGLEMSPGKNVEYIIETLTKHSQKELPQNVVYTLNDWTRQYKEVVVAPVLLLEFSGEEVAEQICKSTKLQKFGLRQIAPSLLAANAESNLQELRNILSKDGITVHFKGSFRERK